jgi:hypothetical protein
MLTFTVSVALNRVRQCPSSAHRKVAERPPSSNLGLLAFDSGFPPLCFHNLTNCFSRNPFRLITFQNARGVPALSNVEGSPSEISDLRFAIHSAPRPLRRPPTPFYSSGYALFCTLCVQTMTQPPCFQSLPHSFANTGGGPPGIHDFRRRRGMLRDKFEEWQ